MRRLLVALALLSALPPVLSAGPVMPGTAAPGFTLQDVSGTSYSLSDYAGKVVLLAFVGYG